MTYLFLNYTIGTDKPVNTAEEAKQFVEAHGLPVMFKGKVSSFHSSLCVFLTLSFFCGHKQPVPVAVDVV